jgi:hypothetical protein
MAGRKQFRPGVRLFRSYESEAVLVVVNLGKEPVSDYSLSLDKGPLQAVNTFQLLLSEGQASAPVVNTYGGFEPHQPLPEQAPYQSVLIWLDP